MRLTRYMRNYVRHPLWIPSSFQLLQFWSLKAIGAIAGILELGTYGGGTATRSRQQSADQACSALKSGSTSGCTLRSLSGSVGRAETDGPEIGTGGLYW